jgi:hypothetical protein
MDRQKKIFWIIIIVIVALLSVLILFLPKQISGYLIIEGVDGEITELSIQYIKSLAGIDFENMVPSTETNQSLLRFYERYKQDKGDSLISVYYIEQFIGGKPYTRLIFHSADGVRVMIQPSSDVDSLILITLEKNKEEYSLRLIMPRDNFSQRWLKNVVRIVIE